MRIASSRAQLGRQRPAFSVLMIVVAALISFAIPFSASAQDIRGTSFTTSINNHTLAWNDDWTASLSNDDDFSTTVMLEGQIMIYSVMFIHNPLEGLNLKSVYHSLSGAFTNSFDTAPTQIVEWEEEDGSFHGAYIIPLSGIDFVMYIRVDPAVGDSGPIMQIAAAPVRAFPSSFVAMQTELTIDDEPVLSGDDGSEIMALLEEQPAPAAAGATDSEATAADSSDSTSDRASQSLRPSSERGQDSAQEPQEAEATGGEYTNPEGEFTVTYGDGWIDMATNDETVGEFSLVAETSRVVASFNGRATTETNRQEFFEDIVDRESRYTGYVGSVITEDRLLIATWTSDSELAVLEYVFVNDTTVVTVMVTITSSSPDRYIEGIQGIELNGEPILRDWDDLWKD